MVTHNTPVLLQITSSFAVAEKPRDALCPSVGLVSFNGVLPRAQSFIIVNYASVTAYN